MELVAIVIAIASVIIPVVVLFMIRGLDKGAKDRNHIRDDLDTLGKEVSDTGRNLAILEERVRNYINGGRMK